MKRRLGLVIIVCAVVCSAGARVANAQLPLADTVCRKSIGRGVRTFAGTLLNEIAKCHRRRMLGRIGAGIDCNNVGAAGFPGATRVIQATGRLVTTVRNGCQATATSPQDNGYRLCPDPCGANAITVDYQSFAACLSCVARESITSAAGNIFGTPPISGRSAQERCQFGIGTGLRRYAVARMAAQQQCAFDQDRAPTALDCKAVDTVDSVAAALANANHLIARACADPTIAALHSCGADVASEQVCIRALAEARSDSLFDQVYVSLGASPTPTLAAPSATPPPPPTPILSTCTPTPAVPSATPPSTPTPTYDPASCANDQPWPVVEPLISPTDLLEQTINLCGRNTESFTLQVSTSSGYILVSPSSPGQCALPCNISGAGCYAVTIPLQPGVTNYLSACWANSACSTAGCTDVDGNGTRLAIVQNATPAPETTPPPTATATCAPTGTPYCADTCNPCPTIRANCPAVACGYCVQNPTSCPDGEARWCLPYNNCCQCGTPTPLESITPSRTFTATPTPDYSPTPTGTSPPETPPPVPTPTDTPTSTPALAITPTYTPTPTPTCAPTGTPYCADSCNPCPTIRANCPAYPCGLCVQNPTSCPDGKVRWCLPYNNCCQCGTPTPTGTPPPPTPTDTPSAIPATPPPWPTWTGQTSTPTASWTPAPTHTPGAGVFAYIAGNLTTNADDAVVVVDVSTNSIAAVIALETAPTTSTTHLNGIAVTPNGSRLYMTRNASVTVLDTWSRSAIATVPVGAIPARIAITPGGETAYVTSFDGTVSAINTASNTVSTTITAPGGLKPFGIAIAPDGSRAYVCAYNSYDFSGSLLVIDTSANTIVQSVDFNAYSQGPVAAAVSSNGALLYLSHDNATTPLSVLSTASLATVTTVPSGGNYWIDLSPDGTRAYLSGGRTLWVMDTQTYAVVATIPGDVGMRAGVAVTPDGGRAYGSANSYDAALAVIDTSTNSVTATIPLPIWIGRIAIGTITG